MSDYYVLSDESLFLYAAKHYDNPACMSVEEFQRDLNSVRYIKRQFSKYNNTNHIDLKQLRRLVNLIIVFNNRFGPEATPKILFFKMPEYTWEYLKPILIYLNLLPKFIHNIRSEPVNTEFIPMNFQLSQQLKTL